MDSSLGCTHGGQTKNLSRTLNGSYLMACGIGEDEGQGYPYDRQVRKGGGLYTYEGGDAEQVYENPLACDESTESVSVESYTEDEESLTAVRTSRWVQQTRDSHNKSKMSRVISVDIADRSLPAPAEISDGVVVCRICHDDDVEQPLISPCFCSGSMGMLHVACLEQWLGTSDTTKCEICQFQFSINKKPRSCKWFLTNKKLGRERRLLLADLCCCLWYAPSTIATTLSCLIGATHFTSAKKSWEATSLILLATVNIGFFMLWCGFAFRRNLRIYNKWKATHQVIRIKYNPPSKTNAQSASQSSLGNRKSSSIPPETPPSPTKSAEMSQRERITGTPYGSPWPRRQSKLRSTSTPRTSSAYTKLHESPFRIPEQTPINFIRDHMMRKWGMHSSHSSTPVREQDVTEVRQEHTSRNADCREALCMTPILPISKMNPEPRAPISDIWQRGQQGSHLTTTDPVLEGTDLV
ncbi:E3 ubiquitin-protein ligase MARCHF4-like [Ylistrum balloti]|uniref:E3 ubiquitin-protein ligase MARCHF4-like n=1 Tax=Ylistrum balloti TaxID=509963 RepID=UPI002905C5C2|nr:E3 ubiquitin-protein ligase MARCHF4-like [Ylistrum balloti]